MTNSCQRLFTGLASLALACGCSELDNCPDARDPITIDRPDATDKADLIFESSAGWEAFDEFPAKTELRFKHDLGVPVAVKSYLSFTSKATNGAGGGSFTEAAGNEVAWECMDSHTIVIKNDTCERSFFVKVVAFGSPNGATDDDRCGP
jgi:hypothetical protein